MVEIEKHAEAILRALMIGGDEEPTDKPRVLEILTALADEVAGEMRERPFVKFWNSGFSPSGMVVDASLPSERE